MGDKTSTLLSDGTPVPTKEQAEALAKLGYPGALKEMSSKKKRARVGPGPWDAAPCTHLRWNLMGFFREKLAIIRTKMVVTLKDGTQQEVEFKTVDISCTKCSTKMTLQAK